MMARRMNSTAVRATRLPHVPSIPAAIDRLWGVLSGAGDSSVRWEDRIEQAMMEVRCGSAGAFRLMEPYC